VADDSPLDVEDVPDVGVVDELTLAGDFDAPSLGQWRGLVAKVLKVDPTEVAEPETGLDTVLLGGIELKPLYTAADALPGAGLPGQAPYLRGATASGNRGGWDVRQRYAYTDPTVARERVMEDLEGGVSSLWLAVGEGGFPAASLPDVLHEVYLDLATVALDAGTQGREAADAFLALADDKSLGNLGIDPLGLLARTGSGGDLTDVAELGSRCATEFPGVRAVAVDALPYHEAGATDVLELGCALATGVAYLRALDDLPIGDAFRQLEFRLAATDDQFSTIAALRAARRLWARVAELCGANGDVGMRQHAVSSPAMYARRDAHNNILRGAIACFSGGVGGADAVTVLPYDAAIGQPDALARRVARNTHAVIALESNVARVIDPAGGSWYVEQLTEQIATRAWAWFQEIEAAGGMAAALSSGLVADRITAAREERITAIGRGDVVLTGVSAFPNLAEQPLIRDPLPPVPTGGLPRVRWSQWHEALRDRADALDEPGVLVATVGEGTPQTGRISSLLAPVGLTAKAGEPGPAAVVVVATTDDTDPTSAIEAAQDAGAALVLGPDDVGKGTDVLALGGRILDALEGQA
jgi:methylmalonyl-CoA mutase